MVGRDSTGRDGAGRGETRRDEATELELLLRRHRTHTPSWRRRFSSPDGSSRDAQKAIKLK